MIDRYLSIWEIAHRWRNFNPDKTDPTDLPLNVQDTIRYICRGALDGRVALFHLVVMSPDGENDGSHFRSEIRSCHVSEIPSELENALYRKYDKTALNAYFIEAENLFSYCLYEQGETLSNGIPTLDFPECWSQYLSKFAAVSCELDDSELPKEVNLQALRPSQIDKLICQAIARTLWDEYPQMTIVAMTEHKAIQEYGGGKLYTGKNTLRDWLSEVAPEGVKKPGRPKSSKSNNDAS